jgi:hypothetical protein
MRTGFDEKQSPDPYGCSSGIIKGDVQETKVDSKCRRPGTQPVRAQQHVRDGNCWAPTGQIRDKHSLVMSNNPFISYL